ncbi:MAG: hypothetical protein PHY43_11815 [Verrucomicrobiales bacterium]|nr:hypothetical protein [Verrucomicrobiales bacterium]
MKPLTSSLFRLLAVLAMAFTFVGSARAQTIAYDEAGNYLVEASWTNNSNLGFGFTPWVIVTNNTSPGTSQFHGNYITAAPVLPAFANASITNVSGVNYTNVWGIFANGTNGANETTAYRGFANPLGTNTFKLQWGSKGAGVTTTANDGVVHGWCGFTLRNGNETSTSGDFETGVRFYLYFLDGNNPSTLYVWDGGTPAVRSVPGTSFSDLGRGNITNAVEAEVTVGADGNTYHLVLKDVVVGRTLYTLDSTLMGSGTIDSAALFCHEATGDQVYNRMQITVPRIPPTILSLQPTNGSLYLDYLAPSTTNISFEVDSFVSTVASNFVTVSLNGVPQSNLTFNTPSSTNKLLVNFTAPIAPDNLYNYTVTAQDANGDVSTNTFTFNTFLASDLFIDAYDYNYGGGQFINNNTPINAYAGLLGTNGIDYSISDLTGVNNTAGYRPGDLPQILSLNTDATGDPIDHANLRLNGYTAYNIGFTDTGNWENYTRAVPSPTNYSIYARVASGGGGQFEIGRLTNSIATTTNQPLAALGRVNVPVTGGSKIFSGQLIPLTDIFGNTVVVPLSGTNTLRCTAISSQGYNLEYLVVVAVTNATGTLRPYLATATPSPNSTGAGLASPIVVTIANRQTAVVPTSINMFLILNNVTNNVTASLVLKTNLGGATATYTTLTNLLPNTTNALIVTYTDDASVSFTNYWTFVTANTGGLGGNGVWSGGGGANMDWSVAANWTGGTPSVGNSALFASAGATTSFVTNNIVSANTTIQSLTYATNNSGYHTTFIANGVTLTVTNGATGVNPVVQVGGASANNDNVFNTKVTNTITGLGGTLRVLGNPLGSSSANQLNFQVRQSTSASSAVPDLTTLDMSGLGTLIATVGKFYVAQGGSGANQSNVSGRVYLARTNVITCLRAANAGQFEVGDSSGGAYTLAGSTLYLGITNALYVDTMRFGKNRATNNLIRFNPNFIGANPVAYMRGTNGGATRLTTWTIADADNETTTAGPVFVSADVDFSGGKLDALVNTMVVGRGATAVLDSGFSQGTLTLTSGTLDVNNLTNGVQRANNTATESGTVNVTGTATLISTNITLAQAASGATASLVTGTLNVTNGTVRGNIVAGGGVSTVNVNAGTLTVTGAAGTLAAPLTALNLTSAALHLNVDGSNTAAIVNATAVSASGTTIITIDSVTNVTGTLTNHLISYTGSDPFSGFSLAPLPSGYTGSLLDSSGSVDLIVTFTPAPPSPTIGSIKIIGGQVVIGGTNNNGAGGIYGYSVLSSTNIALPVASWTLVNSGSFDISGNFSSTNAAGTNSARFYILRVP